MRGSIHENLGELDKAVADFNKLAVISPDNYQAYLLRGKILFKQENLPAALDDMNKLIKLRPNDVDAYFLRADIFRKLENGSHWCKDFYGK